LNKEVIEIRALTRIGLVLILVGLMVVLSLPVPTAADGESAGVIRVSRTSLGFS
jgi:hypothetical protein